MRSDTGGPDHNIGSLHRCSERDGRSQFDFRMYHQTRDQVPINVGSFRRACWLSVFGLGQHVARRFWDGELPVVKPGCILRRCAIAHGNIVTGCDQTNPLRDDTDSYRDENWRSSTYCYVMSHGKESTQPRTAMGILPRRRVCSAFAVVLSATVFPISDDGLRKLHEALAAPMDWDHFFAVIRKQRVAALVYHAMAQLPTGRVPDFVMARLKEQALETARHGLFAAMKAHTIVSELAAADITAVILKGTPLAVLLYGHAGLRQAKDIDLLVASGDVERADALIRRLGFVRIVPPPSFSGDALRAFQMYRSHYEYVAGTKGTQVELHWRLAVNECFGPQSSQPSTWQSVTVGAGLKLPTLSRVDLAEYLCMHGASHGWSRLKWLADVATMLKHDQDLIEALLEQSRLHGTSRAVGQALLLCEQLYGWAPVKNSDHGVAVRLLAAVARRAMTIGCAAGELLEERRTNAAVHLSHFLLSGQFRYLKTELRNELLMPPAWMHRKPTMVRRLLHSLRGIHLR